MNTQDSGGVSTAAADDTTQTTPASSNEDSQVTTNDSSGEESRSLSTEARSIIENFSSLSTEKQVEKLASLETSNSVKSGKGYQNEALGFIRENFTLPEITAEQETATPDLEAMEKRLEEKFASKFATQTQEIQKIERDKHIKAYLTKNKIDATVDDVLNDKNFWSSFLDPETQELPVYKRVKFTMMENYHGDSSWLTKQQLAANASGMAQGGNGTTAKKKNTLGDYAKMNTADWEAQR